MISQLLQEVQSSNVTIRNQAQARIDSFKLQNPQNFLLEISCILVSDQYPKEARQLAALMIKNTVSDLQIQIWSSFDSEIAIQVKENCLASLAANDRDVRKATSQAVAAIAKQDLPKGKWENVLKIMINNAGHSNPAFRQVALDTLGFICEELDPGCLSVQQADEILTAIANNLSYDDLSVRYVALRALSTSLPFYESNIKNDHERQVLLRLVYSNASVSNENVKIMALKVLLDIAGNYCEYIGPNLIDLGNVTYEAIRSDIQYASILGIEF